jgi:serine/threonine protein kinase
MTPERFARIDELFNATLDQPVGSRTAYLEKECGDDLELMAEVQAMLAVDGDEGQTIGKAMMDGAEAWSLATEEQAIGQRLGHYKITGFLGRGGMGAVYRGVRDDAAFEKEVAIKLLRVGLDSRNVLRRFEQERQILARLEHPHIARLLDGGTSVNGLPFLVMEYVEDAVTVTQYCRQMSLDLEKRILLFLDICAAVAYAHQQLVVHRDLKPGNILVDKAGAVKLLDFGIARVMDESGEQTVTVAGAQMLTPEYASPEQVRGEPVSTATDVYSLGVILYEMLTGEKAQKIGDTSMATIERVICEVEPVRPSLAAGETGPVPQRALRGDLDNIILKALHKERERRYASVDKLSEDLRNYLQGLPVLARPDSFGYRASKFFKRNRVTVALSGAVAASLFAGGFLQWRQAQVNQRRFEQVRGLSKAFLFEFHDAVVNLPGGTKARQLIVQKGLEYLRVLAQDAGSDNALQKEIALGYERVGDVQGNPLGSNIGDTKGALASYREAVRLLEEVWKREGQPLQSRESLLRAHNKLATILRNTSDTAGAVEHYQRAIMHGEAYVKGTNGDADGLHELASAHDQLARASASIGLDDALTSARRAVEIREELTFMGVTNRQRLAQLGSSYATLGIVLNRKGKVEEGLKAFYQNVGIQERLAKESPDDAQRQRTMMIALSHIGDTLGSQDGLHLGRTAEGAAAYARVVEIARWLVSVDPQDKKARLDLGFALLRSSTAYKTNKERDKSLRAMEEARRLMEDLVRSDPENGRLSENVAFLRYMLADDAMARSNFKLALDHVMAAESKLSELVRKDPKDNDRARMLLECYVIYPRILLKLNMAEEARKIAVTTENYAANARFRTSNSPRVRTLVVRALLSAGAAHGGDKEREILRRAETEMKRIETDGITGPYIKPTWDDLRAAMK